MQVSINIDAIKGFGEVLQEPSSPIKLEGLTANSSKVKKNYLFIAERGVSRDGHDFIPTAIQRGAVALLVEQVDKVPKDFLGLVLKAKNTRALAPHIASHFYGTPSQKLFAIGITGTNGKTSLTYLLEHIFNEAHRPTGVIGTINHHIGAKVWATEMTTPHPIELQERLAEFCKEGAQALAIEVSSHAIDQKRIEGIDFDVVVFTNLTRDHLDYHSSMEEYFEVKQHLFKELIGQSKKHKTLAVVNTDDSWGQRIQVSQGTQKWTYGESHTDFSYKLHSMTFSGTHFEMKTPSGTVEIQSPLIGVHNIYNVMAAAAVALGAGLSLDQIANATSTFKGIPGRLQLVPHSKGPSVVVDYAHSPDSLENVLKALQKVRHDFHGGGKIISVFGCGGDRDKGKRPLMAQIAEALSDMIIITSDNPRTEEPLQIIEDIKTGISSDSQKPLFIEPDRAKAIALALSQASLNDVVLIAGKGHEDYQIIGKEKFYFSDYETARKLLL